MSHATQITIRNLGGLARNILPLGARRINTFHLSVQSLCRAVSTMSAQIPFSSDFLFRQVRSFSCFAKVRKIEVRPATLRLVHSKIISYMTESLMFFWCLSSDQTGVNSVSLFVADV